MATSHDRSTEIDGIRGWASFCVLWFHLLVEVFGRVIPGIHGTLPFAILNGHFAVLVFFVLSGDALSIGFLRRGDRRVIDSLLVRRYFRLTIPVALACAIVYVLMKSGLVFNREAGRIVDRMDWLGSFLDFQPGLASLLRYVLIDVYLPRTYEAPATQYNVMLWTMAAEMAGSMMVFLFWYVASALRRPMVVLGFATAVLCLLGSYLALFFFGILLAQARQNGWLDRLRSDRRWQVAAPLVMLAAGIAAAAIYEKPGSRPVSLTLAGVFVCACYTSRLLVAFFRQGVSQFLGRISFPLYLTHFCVIVSLTSWMIVRAGQVDLATAWSIAGVSALAAVVLAALFLPVETAALAWVNRRTVRLLKD